MEQKNHSGYTIHHGTERVMVEFNINDFVWVRLTDVGREIYRKKFAAVGMDMYGEVIIHYTPPKEDGEGWSRWQLHHLMETFGEHVHLTGPLSFETDIRIETKLENEQ